jgi:hypothetical protein
MSANAGSKPRARRRAGLWPASFIESGSFRFRRKMYRRRRLIAEPKLMVCPSATSPYRSGGPPGEVSHDL